MKLRKSKCSGQAEMKDIILKAKLRSLCALVVKVKPCHWRKVASEGMPIS